MECKVLRSTGSIGKGKTSILIEVVSCMNSSGVYVPVARRIYHPKDTGWIFLDREVEEKVMKLKEGEKLTGEKIVRILRGEEK